MTEHSAPRIDHVIIASRDVPATAARLARDHGIVAQAGGSHPGWGTYNWIAPLGGAYLEVIGIEDAELAARDPLGRAVLGIADRLDALIGFAVEVDDVAATGDRLDLTVERGARDRPDGTRLSWLLAGRPECGLGARPFFIQWHDRASRPGLLPQRRERALAGIAWLETGGDADALAAWAGPGLPVRCDGSTSGVVAVAIATADGQVVLG